MSNDETLTAEASTIVTESDLASAHPDTREVFPPVFATARMVSLMELAAARCLLPRLRDAGERSVGVSIEVTHNAPTPLGCRVTARATWLGQEGKAHRFSVVVEDEAGEVGRGTHTRVIVQTERLLAGATKRARAH